MAMKRAIFLDRDGVINQLIDKVYVNEWADFVFCERVFETFDTLALTKFKVIIVSNQAGIGHGYAEHDAIESIFNIMKKRIVENSNFPANRLSYYFCPHKPEALCACRKPAPGMIYRAAVEQEVTIHNSWLIGDSNTDLIAGIYGGLHPGGLIKVRSIQNSGDSGVLRVMFPAGAVDIRLNHADSFYHAVMDLLLLDEKLLSLTDRAGRAASVEGSVAPDLLKVFTDK